MIRLAILLVWLMSLPLAAQELRVGSGDHRGFTRLTFPLPDGADWRLGRSDGGYALQIDPPVDYRIDRVFRRVSRDRIAGLSAVPGTGRLDIAVTCDCRAEILPWRDNWLVIDIVDGTVDPASPWEQPIDPVPVPAPVPQSVVLPLLAAEPLPMPLLPDPFDRSRDDRVSDIAAAMARGIADGSAQGLLDLAVRPSALDVAPSSRPEPPVTEATAPPTAAPDEGTTAPIAPAEPTPADRPGIVTITSIERDRRALETPTIESSACLPDSSFDLAAWSGSGDFGAEISAARIQLTTETGIVPSAAVENLARVHIAFGFGLEAEAALRTDGIRSVGRDLLVLMARVVDDRPADGDLLGDQVGCTSAVALWRALAAGDVSGLTEPERTAAVAAFRLLPDTLRDQLAPRLAALFARAGDPLVAADLLSGADLSAAPDRRAMAEAAIATADAAPDRTLAALEVLASTDAAIGPVQLLDLIDTGLALGQRPPEDRLDLLRAMRFEYRERPENTALARAEVRLLSALDRHTEALALAMTEEIEERAATLAEVVSAIANRTDDVLFLELVLTGLPPGVPPDPVNAVAARLIDLGFHAEAATLVAPDAEGAAGRERRYLRAAAAAGLDQPDAVEAALVGLDDARATMIRAAAGLPVPAATDPSLAERQAWQDGDWNAVGSVSDPLARAAATAMTETTALAPDAPPLAARETLIAEAEAARQLARELLDRYAAPPDVGP